MQYSLGFIGCGNMGGALVKAVAKRIGGEKIAVCDHNDDKVQTLKNACGVSAVDIQTVAKECAFVVLGVKPQTMQATLQSVAKTLQARTDVTLITMAAGVSMRAIRSFVGADLPVIRIMPNTPAALGAGMILYDHLGVSEATEKTFLDCFAGAGLLDKLPEEKIDAASALSGCGPAFVYIFAEALADGAVECGMTRDKAELYAAQTLLGSAKMLLEFGNPAELKDAVCSPGGTTIAGVHALEKAGFRNAAMDAVTAAYKRTLELKK